MLLSTLLASKAAVALGSAALVLGGGTAAVAAAHVLPAVLDDAPGVVAASSDGSTSSEPAGSPESTDATEPSDESPSTDSAAPVGSPSSSERGPDATGPAAFGLCTAYSHGGIPPQSVAYQALARAAGTGTIEEYCATVKHPGGKPSPSTSESTSTQRHGKPSTVPSPGTTHGKSGSHGKPSTAPGRPSTAPTR